MDSTEQLKLHMTYDEENISNSTSEESESWF
jgi:hypothetical protein